MVTDKDEEVGVQGEISIIFTFMLSKNGFRACVHSAHSVKVAAIMAGKVSHRCVAFFFASHLEF